MTDPRARLRDELADATAQVARLERDLAEVVAASEGSNADDEHDPEGHTIGFERAQITALLASARARRVDVERALERVTAGAWETCERCGGEIGRERLAARPATRLCVRCAAVTGR